MDVFKIPSLSAKPIPITTKEAFESFTKKQKPWIQLISDAMSFSWRYYAQCPHCDNAIIIIGFNPTHTQTPHGKHYMVRSVNGVGFLDRSAYEACPYRNQANKKLSKEDKYSTEHHLPSKALNILIEHFDRAIYLLEKELQIKFSTSCLKRMLEDFRASQGWLYKGVSEQNIPWIFAYFTLSKSLYKQRILNKTLKNNLLALEPKLQFDKHETLLVTDGLFFKTSFSFFDHQRSVNDHHLIESITFKVSDKNNRDLYIKKIEFDPLHFANLINMDEEKAKEFRNFKLVEMARAVFR